MNFYRMAKDEPLTAKKIKKYVENFKGNRLPRLTKLYEYYVGKHAIENKTVSNPAKPNNKITVNFCRYISNILTGYFAGEPVAYSSENEDLYNILSEIFKYNDEQAETASIATDCSVYGVGYELVFRDEDKELRFKKIDPKGCIPILGDTLDDELLYFLRFYEVEDIVTLKTKLIIEVYDDTYKTVYEMPTAGGNLTIKEAKAAHGFTMVPVAIFLNNEDGLGDFEGIISMNDAYNKAQSDAMDDLDSFSDAIFAITGFQPRRDDNGNPEPILRENRLLILDDPQAKAQYVTKDTSGEKEDKFKSRLEIDIHKTSHTPNLQDEKFDSSSGIAIKFKLATTEQLAAVKERGFKKGLQKRLEILCSALNQFMGDPKNYLEMDMKFTRSMPESMQDIATLIGTTSGLLSDETRIGLLGNVIDIPDAQKEIEKRNEEEKARGEQTYNAAGSMLDGDEEDGITE